MDQRVIYRPSAPITAPLKKQPAVPLRSGKESFDNFLRPAMENINKGIKISKHAEQRIQQQWSQLEEKLAEAKQKGLNDSLVLMDQAALIVNAKNNTVITAMDRSEASSQIFTNINGAIILD